MSITPLARPRPALHTTSLCPAPVISRRSTPSQVRRQQRMRLTALAAAPLGLTAAAAATAAGVGVAMARGSRELRPIAKGESTSWNSAMLSLCPSLTAPYRMPSWMPLGGHFETIFAAWFRYVHADSWCMCAVSTVHSLCKAHRPFHTIPLRHQRFVAKRDIFRGGCASNCDVNPPWLQEKASCVV
jgi:hypothetical protein